MIRIGLKNAEKAESKRSDLIRKYFLDRHAHAFYTQLCDRISKLFNKNRKNNSEIFYHEKIRIFFYLCGTLFLLFCAQKAHVISGVTFLEKWFQKNPPPMSVVQNVFKTYGYLDVTSSEKYLKAVKNIPFYENDSQGIWVSPESEVVVLLWNSMPENSMSDSNQGVALYALSEKPQHELFYQKTLQWEFFPFTWEQFDLFIKKLEKSYDLRMNKPKIEATQKKILKKWKDPREVFY